MGNTQGKKYDKSHDIIKKMNCIVASYIIDMDVENLKKILDIDYCNDLILLISKLLNQYLSKSNIDHLFENITQQSHKTNNNNNKNSIEISKFYVKIIHLFSILLSTINESKNFKQILNKDQQHKQSGGSGIGTIPEFIDLYNDSGYELKTGRFLSMKPETKSKYNNDLKQFYIIFTQNKDIPELITKFSDIPIDQQYNKEDEEEEYKEEYTDNITGYAANLKKIVSSINRQHTKLLKILNSVFEMYGTGKICINSSLNHSKLQNLIDEAREIIFEFYLNYEEDYLKNTKLYEAFVLSQIIETSKNQLKTLEEEKLRLI